MGWVYGYWVLLSIALVGAAVDIAAVRRGVAGRLASVSLALKTTVLFAFAAWWAYYRFIAAATTMEDLAAFAGLLVLSQPVLAVALICDGLVARALARQASR